MEFKIEKGIQMPDKKTWGRKYDFPFEKMEIGDSFLIEWKKPMTAAFVFAKNHSIKITSRLIDKENNISRVWHIG